MPARIINVFASTTVTASGSADLRNFGGTTRFALTVTAASGTGPTLDVVIEDTVDGVNYFTIATYAQKTTAEAEVLDVPALTANARVNYTVAGTTPSFDFQIDAIAV